ncbi:hypothetical protein GGQ99_004799 [Aminobacter niigataensis]|uniref:Uncharacterized protein n=1 Tax=Aminobacter niigataensis TaxID=83265 RepID=A0ABR6L887_9HYPH|nr:hypothetical protein [Aminobacter niigataensis]MBB4653015.1 hypothetical protein [Aminobacter niigataensis]
MKAKEKAIRDAAEALRVAIVDGQATGIAVTWPPRRVADLSALEISDTGKAADEPAESAKAPPKK